MRTLRAAIALVLAAGVVWFALNAFVAGDPAPARAGSPDGSVSQDPGVGSEVGALTRYRYMSSGLVLRVVSGAGQPIAGATVVVAGRSATQMTSEVGVVALGSIDAEAALLVRAAGFQPSVVVKKDLALAPDGVAILALQVAATLRVRAVTSGGAPVAGVHLRLLPRLSSGEWAHDWKRVSDKASLSRAIVRAADRRRDQERRRGGGSSRMTPSEPIQGVSVEDLLSLPEREVILASNAEVVLGGGGSGSAAPIGDLLGSVTLPGKYALLFNSLDRVTDDAGWASWDELPPNPCELGVDSVFWADREDPRFREERWLRGQITTRAIDLFAGAVSQVVLQVPGASDDENTVGGRIATPAARGASVSVNHESMAAGTHGGMHYKIEREESTCTPDATGRFLFRGIQPGQKVVRAKWSEGRNDVCFASASGVLIVDGQLDVGTLRPRPGPVVEVAIGHRGADGILAASDDSDLNEKLLALRVETLGDDLDTAAGISDYVPVKVGDVVRLIGAMPGRLSLQLAWFGREELLRERFVMPRVYSGRVEESPHVRLDIETLQYVDVAIEVVWPVGFPQRSVMLHLVSGEADVEQVQLRPNQKSVKLRAGEWAVLAESSLFPSGVDAGVFARSDQVRIVPSSSQPRLALSLLPAVALSGVAEAEFMARRNSQTLLWQLSGGAIYAARVDEAGAFRVEGIPPNAVLKGLKGLSDVATKSAGEQSVVLR